MTHVNRIVRCGFLLLFVGLLAGCAGTRTVGHEAAADLLARSDYQSYAAQYLDSKGQPKYDPESLLDTLEAGKAFNDAGMWAFSRDAFDAAGKLLNWKEDTVDTPEEVANLLGTALTSDAFGAYQGKIHQGALVDYYQAINHLMLGNEANARVDFNRLQVRQSNAVVQLNAYAKTVDRSVKKGLNEDESIGAKQSLGEVGPKVADGIKDLPNGLTKSKIRVAAGDVMGAVFRATSSANSDKRSNAARDMLKDADSASATRGGNAMIAYLGREIRQGKGQLKNKIVVVYEDGVGPSLKEFRIDLPLFLVTSKVTYTGIALPQFSPGQPAFGSLNIGSGKSKEEFATLTNINELAGLEFDAAYKGIVAKAVISTIIKTTAQAVVNNQIDKEASPLLGALLKVGTGVAQLALTRADTRAWANLPNTIQMAVIDRPQSGVLSLSNAVGQSIVEVPLKKDGVNTLVLIKAAGTGGQPAIYLQELPVQAPAEPLQVASAKEL